MSSQQTIAVLGLGRMGAAMAARLGERGQEVTGWTRSGRAIPGITTVDDPIPAVAKVDVVLLALFDGPACLEVVDLIAGALKQDVSVINTSTIAPVEATTLAQRLGPSYVHAPVLGSVAAAAGGTLKILAGADEGAIDRIRPVLDALGELRVVGDAATAAALKLVANSTLAGAVLALRDSLEQAAALGLSREQVLDVLELGQLGGLVARKRPFLTGEQTNPEFTVGALAKDMALLADASGWPLSLASELAESPAGPDADFALSATEAAADPDVLVPLQAYVSGHATGDPAYFREAFLPTAHVEGLRDGQFVSWPVDEYCALFNGHPAPDEATRSRRIDRVDMHGSVATAAMTLWHGPDTFTDVFLLVRVDGRWRIANKAYHRH